MKFAVLKYWVANIIGGWIVLSFAIGIPFAIIFGVPELYFGADFSGIGWTILFIFMLPIFLCVISMGILGIENLFVVILLLFFMFLFGIFLCKSYDIEKYYRIKRHEERRKKYWDIDKKLSD